MDREILFRAQRINTNIWVYGYYCYAQIREEHKIISYEDGNQHTYQVKPETVCQYTGLEDKDGKKIFKGDAVVNEASLHMGYMWIVIFEHGAFRGKGTDADYPEGFHFTELFSIADKKIIGNIFDNEDIKEKDIDRKIK